MTMSLRLRAKMDLLKSGLAQLRKVWDESKHPRDPHGRFGSGGSSSQPGVYWHGTVKSLIENIRKLGLIPHERRSSQGMSLYGHVPGYKQSVFMTNDFEVAKDYAQSASMMQLIEGAQRAKLRETGGRSAQLGPSEFPALEEVSAQAAILRLRLTDQQKQQLIVDEGDRLDHEARLGYEPPEGYHPPYQFRLVGRIPPSQIDVMSGNNEWQPLAKVATFEHIFYVVIPVVSGAIGK